MPLCRLYAQLSVLRFRAHTGENLAGEVHATGTLTSSRDSPWQRRLHVAAGAQPHADRCQRRPWRRIGQIRHALLLLPLPRLSPSFHSAAETREAMRLMKARVAGVRGACLIARLLLEQPDGVPPHIDAVREPTARVDMKRRTYRDQKRVSNVYVWLPAASYAIKRTPRKKVIHHAATPAETMAPRRYAPQAARRSTPTMSPPQITGHGVRLFRRGAVHHRHRRPFELFSVRNAGSGFKAATQHASARTRYFRHPQQGSDIVAAEQPAHANAKPRPRRHCTE